MQKNNGLTYTLFIAIVLFIVIVFRAFTTIDDYWIQIINLTGLFIALLDVFINVKQQYKNSKKFDFYTGIYFVLLIVIIILAIAVFFRRIDINEKWSDIITLFTIWVSVPKTLHIKVIGKIIK